MKRDDIVTLIQTEKAHSLYSNTVDTAMRTKILNGILFRIIDGDDKLQIVTWLNGVRKKAGKDKQHIIDAIWKNLGDKIVDD